MKTTIKLCFLSAVFSLLLVSCDEVTNPVIIETTLDTSLYTDGNFVEYEFPTFEENTNTQRNAVIADYTGHTCTFCPPAAISAKNIEDANPDKAFVVTIHGGGDNSGFSNFQETSEPTYTKDFTTPEGLEMAGTFFQASIGFVGNPRGTVNRIAEDDGTFFFPHTDWAEKAEEVFASDLNVNIQAKSNYFEGSKGVYLHVETEFLTTLDGDYNLVVYVIDEDIVAPQKYPSYTEYDYHHHNVHIGNVFNETWGRRIASGTATAGTKIQSDLSYKVPDDLTREELHFIVVVFNRDTYEIEQAIKHKF